MPDGLSTNRNCEAFGDCLLQAGKAFVVRYHASHTLQPHKRLTPREAAQLARAGLDIVTVYQDRGNQPGDFSLARGEQDGHAAFTFASQVGQPPGSAVYFAVDADMSMAQVNDAVLPYFQGVRAGLAAMAGGTGGSTGFRVGVYGSGRVCQRVKENHALAELSWLAQSTGWADSKTYATWDMQQGFASGPLCALGTHWEHVEARGDAGDFALRPLARDEGAGELGVVGVILEVKDLHDCSSDFRLAKPGAAGRAASRVRGKNNDRPLADNRRWAVAGRSATRSRNRPTGRGGCGRR